MTTLSIYVLGTDTDVGKTAFTCALLLGLQHLGERALPQKPAASGPTNDAADPQRLIAASGVALRQDQVTAYHARASKAPGLIEYADRLAHDPDQIPVSPHTSTSMRPDDAQLYRPSSQHAKLREDAEGTPRPRDTASPPPKQRAQVLAQAQPASPQHSLPLPPSLERAQQNLHRIIAAHAPDIVLIEGAGGWHVPMPDGTWQAQWVSVLADAIIIVARPGLGTINHTLLTIAAAMSATASSSLPILGFAFSAATDEIDPLARENAAVIQARAGVPYLGTLPHLHELSSASAILGSREELALHCAAQPVVRATHTAITTLRGSKLPGSA